LKRLVILTTILHVSVTCTTKLRMMRNGKSFRNVVTLNTVPNSTPIFTHL